MVYNTCGYICTYMTNGNWTKTKNYRLPKRTLDQLDFLVEKGIFRNATEAIISSVENMATQYNFKVNEQIN